MGGTIVPRFLGANRGMQPVIAKERPHLTEVKRNAGAGQHEQAMDVPGLPASGTVPMTPRPTPCCEQQLTSESWPSPSACLCNAFERATRTIDTPKSAALGS